RQKIGERTCGVERRLDRHRTRKRPERALEVGMAPLNGDERDHAALRAAEACERCVPGRLRERSHRRAAATGLLAERLSEDVVDSDRDLPRRAGAGAHTREWEDGRGGVAKLPPERARCAGLLDVGVTQLVLPG